MSATNLFDAPTILPSEAVTAEDRLTVILEAVGDPDRLRVVARGLYWGRMRTHGQWLYDLAATIEELGGGK